VYFNQENYESGLIEDEVQLEPGNYTVVVNMNQHYGYYEVTGEYL
jgi:hypothetical protein